MRRLSFLVLGFVLAWLGIEQARSGDVFAPYLLADALLLCCLGALTFAWQAGGWLPPLVFRRRRGLLRTGWTLLLTGLLVTAGGGLGIALGLPGIAGLTARMAWGLGILLQLAGAWWPGAAREYAQPPVRWGRDAAGQIVPLPAGESGGSTPGRRQTSEPVLAVRSWALWFVAVLALAALLRFWNLEQLPPGCIDQECAAALQLIDTDTPTNSSATDGTPAADGAGPSAASAEGATAPAATMGGLRLDERLAQFLVRVTGSGILALRLAAALLGWLTVFATGLALRRIAGPFPALLGAALLAISPWHLWASRSSDPWIGAACLTALVLWLGLEALARNHARWWIPWGLAAGLLAAQAPVLWLGISIWILATTASGLLQARQYRGRVGAGDSWRWPLCGLAAAVGAALPVLFTLRSGVPTALAAGTGLNNSVALAAALLRPEASASGAIVQSGLLNAGVAALAVAGIGALLRHVRQVTAILVLTGTAALAVAVALLDLASIAPATALLPLLPLLVASTTVALDRLLAALVAAWGPPLVRTSTLLAGSALVVLLLTSRGTASLLLELDAVQGSGGTQVETEMARYIGAQLGSPEGQNVTFVAPQAVLEHPSLRLLAGAAVAERRILPLEPGRTLPFAQEATGDVMYLLPLLDSEVLDLLRQLYPNGQAVTEVDASGERAQFNRFLVRQNDLRQAQTLQMTLAAASPDAATASTSTSLAVPALDFAWASVPPMDPPFTAHWEGALVAPESGSYSVAIENSGPESGYTLTIDDILLLDSSLGLQQQDQMLAQGMHRLRLDYRSGSQPGNLRVTWQQAGESPQTIAAPWVHSPMPTDQGLLGEYYANGSFEGPIVATHKDPVIGLDPGLELPYSVRWHGLLAAPRAGDYLIGVDAPGLAQVIVDGQVLADNTAGRSAEPATTYSEGVIYLPAGWHNFEVRYVPDAKTAGAAGELRLLWQPPGSDPSELGSRFLLPAYTMIGPADTPLPPAPALSDSILGDDRFALSRPLPVWQPSVRIPPSSLPPLPLERLWTAGGVCGSAQDQLAAPHGAAYSADGSKLYVADTGNRRIQVFSADGAPLQTIESDQFQEPVGVTTGVDGSLLVLDAAAQQVFRVQGDGSSEAVPLQTSFYRPRGLATDIAGNLVIADTGGGRVVVLAPDGSQTLQFGGQGTALAKGQPVSALAPPGALWAISAEDGRLWNLTSDGSVTAVQPTSTVDGPQLAGLGDGRLLATDPARASFILFTPFGEPLGQFGYPGELQLPTGIAATGTPEGDVIAVVDTGACAVSAWRLGQ